MLEGGNKTETRDEVQAEKPREETVELTEANRRRMVGDTGLEPVTSAV